MCMHQFQTGEMRFGQGEQQLNSTAVRRSALFGSRQPSCRTEQPEEYIGYDSLRSPLVPIDRRHFAKPFSVSQKLMVDGRLDARPSREARGVVDMPAGNL